MNPTPPRPAVDPAPFHAVARRLPEIVRHVVPSPPAPDWLAQTRSQDLQRMYRAFEAVGGTLGTEHVLRRFGACHDQPISLLARGIVERSLVHFEWQSALWLPLFQFDPATMVVRDNVRQVLDELSSELDDWDLALWFATPHALLGDRTPAAEALAGSDELRQAARADRFVLRG